MTHNMPNPPLVEVVAAILTRPDDSFLLACRPPGKPYAGYWEFPGGKIEASESALQALSRELHEELGITVDRAFPWITRVFRYPHATVRLQFYRVAEWQGELIAREHQQLAWQSAGNITVSPLLPANQPILRSLMLPSTYAITNASETGETHSLHAIGQALQRGLRLLQIREKHLTDSQLTRYAQAVLQLAQGTQAKVLINGNIALAKELGLDGVHLTAAQLLSLHTRPEVDWCGASCHNEEELYHAESLGIDFVTVSPVCPTPSHPNAPTLGWRKLAKLIRGYSLPVYALGGLMPDDLIPAQEQGAHGIALMRNLCTSAQP